MAANLHVVRTLSDMTGCGLEIATIALERAKNDVNRAKQLLERWCNPSANSSQNNMYGKITTLFNPQKAVAAIVEARCDHEGLVTTKDFYEMVSRCIYEIVDHNHHYEQEWCIEELEKDNNCKIRINYARIEKANKLCLLTTYSHRDNIGVIVETEAENEDAFNNKDFRLFSFDCALHVAAFQPYSVAKSDIPDPLRTELIAQIQKELSSSGKSIVHWPAVIDGKLSKWNEQHSMLSQIFIKSDKDTVAEAKKIVEEKIGSTIKINRIVRLALDV